MAADPVVEYWAEIMKRTPISPELMAQWKRVMDHGIEAWSRALSEVMATEEFAQLLGTSIEQWLAAQASITGNRAQTPAHATQLPALAAQLSRIEERIAQIEERIASSAESAPGLPPHKRRGVAGGAAQHNGRERRRRVSPPPASARSCV